MIDLRAASAVMQCQIITCGRMIWAANSQAAMFESFILTEKTALGTLRAGVIEDGQGNGRVYS